MTNPSDRRGQSVGTPRRDVLDQMFGSAPLGHKRIAGPRRRPLVKPLTLAKASIVSSAIGAVFLAAFGSLGAAACFG